MMTIAQIMEKMIAFSVGNIHDITYLSCVLTYARTIGELAGLDEVSHYLLAVDDIARLGTTGELPVGILTAFGGAPLFLYLIATGGGRRVH